MFHADDMDSRQLINSEAALTLIKGHVMFVCHTLYIYAAITGQIYEYDVMFQ